VYEKARNSRIKAADRPHFSTTTSCSRAPFGRTRGMVAVGIRDYAKRPMTRQNAAPRCAARQQPRLGTTLRRRPYRENLARVKPRCP